MDCQHRPWWRRNKRFPLVPAPATRPTPRAHACTGPHECCPPVPYFAKHPRQWFRHHRSAPRTRHCRDRRRARRGRKSNARGTWAKCALGSGRSQPWHCETPQKTTGRNVCTLRPEGLAGELGFEPRLEESESSVLPLDDSPRTGGGEDQRLLNCVPRRALRRPTFLRSTSRASRVTKPAMRSDLRSVSS